MRNAQGLLGENDATNSRVGAFAAGKLVRRTVHPLRSGHLGLVRSQSMPNGVRTMAGPRTLLNLDATGDSRYLRRAFVAKPGIMNTMEMAKPTISTVLKGNVLAMVLMAMLTTVDPT